MGLGNRTISIEKRHVMKLAKAGIILNTQKYRQCVDFYGNILGLKVLFEIDRQNEQLTTFALGDLYLMVEPDGHSHAGTKPIGKCPTKLRFNVTDVQNECDTLRAKGIHVEIAHHAWGTTAEFCDPDGNRCALRSTVGFGC